MDFLTGSQGLSDKFLLVFIPAAGLIGLLFAVYQWLTVSQVKVGPSKDSGADQALLENGTADEVDAKVAEIQSAISVGK